MRYKTMEHLKFFCEKVREKYKARGPSEELMVECIHDTAKEFGVTYSTIQCQLVSDHGLNKQEFSRQIARMLDNGEDWFKE